MKAGDVITRARATLLDVSGSDSERRWTDRELIDLISSAQRAAVVLDPSANPRTEVIQLSRGVVQKVPGISLTQVVRNMGTDGQTAGRAVRRVDQHVLDRHTPNWSSADRESGEVRHWMWTEDQPRIWFCDPPNTGEGHVEITYVATPEPVTGEDDELSLGDHFEPAIHEYVVAMALSKDVGAYSSRHAQEFYSRFLQLVTGKIESRRHRDPRSQLHRVGNPGAAEADD